MERKRGNREKRRKIISKLIKEGEKKDKMSKTIQEKVEEEAQDFLAVCGKPPTVVMMGEESYWEINQLMYPELGMNRYSYSPKDLCPVLHIGTTVGIIKVLLDPDPGNKDQRKYTAAAEKDSIIFLSEGKIIFRAEGKKEQKMSEQKFWRHHLLSEVKKEEGNVKNFCQHCGTPTILASGSICEDFGVYDEPYESGVIEKPKSGRDTVHVYFEDVSVDFCEKCGKVVYLYIDGLVPLKDNRVKLQGRKVLVQGEAKTVLLYALFEADENGMANANLIMVTRDEGKAKEVWQQGGVVRQERRGLVIGEQVYLLDEDHQDPLAFDVNYAMKQEEIVKRALMKLTEEEKRALNLK